MRCRQLLRHHFVLLLFAGCLVFTTNRLQAQYVGPGRLEIKELKTRIKKEADVKKLFVSFRQVADQALDEAPRPIDTIRSEGLLQGNPKKTATRLALGDMPKMYALALVYRVSGERKYLEKVTAYLKAWATQNTPNGDPIDDTNLDNAIEAYDMVKEQLSPADTMILQAWWRRTAGAEINGPHNRPGRGTATNNWNSHRLKIVGEIAFTIWDTALQTYTISGFKRQVEINLNPDGSSTDFASRDALHYHVYDVEPLLQLAIVLQRATGENYYRYQPASTASVKKSVDWLLPFLNGARTHPEFVNSTVPFDRERAKNGEAAYKSGTLFDPKNGIRTLLLAARFDPTLLPLARQLLQTQDRYPAWQSVLNAL
jgi:Alginate lyase